MAVNRGVSQEPGLGERWAAPSLVWGSQTGNGPVFQAPAAADGHVVQAVELLSPEDLSSLFDQAPLPPNGFDFAPFCSRLKPVLSEMSEELVRSLIIETGFVRTDAEEIVAATIGYLEELPGLLVEPRKTERVREYDWEGRRGIDLVGAPWGLVAIVLPHNAFLPLAVSCAIAARIAGNAVVLRAPSQSARSAALFASALRQAGLENVGISVALASGREFIDALIASSTPTLLHFFGGSGAVGRLLPQCFQVGRSAVFDGQGNVWAYVGKSHPVETVERLVSGAFRFNGQTCTSINGIVVHPDVYDSVRDRLLGRVSSLEKGSQIGCLFDVAQAEACIETVNQSGGRVMTGGNFQGSFLEPTLVEVPDPGSSLVREGVFGGVVWIAKGDEAEFAYRWRHNRYPLCAAVFETDCSRQRWLGRLPGVARLCINGDPSVEDMFEPWGGYGGSGTSPVESFVDKYTRRVQVDAPVD